MAIARCCVTSTELPGDLGHPGQGAGTLWRGALLVAKGDRIQNSISGVKNFQSFKDESSSNRLLGNQAQVARRASRGEIRRSARRGVGPFVVGER